MVRLDCVPLPSFSPEENKTWITWVYLIINSFLSTTVSQREKRLITVPHFTVLGQIISIYRHTKIVYGNIQYRIQAFFMQWLFSVLHDTPLALVSETKTDGCFFVKKYVKENTNFIYHIHHLFIPHRSWFKIRS